MNDTSKIAINKQIGSYFLNLQNQTHLLHAHTHTHTRHTEYLWSFQCSQSYSTTGKEIIPIANANKSWKLRYLLSPLMLQWTISSPYGKILHAKNSKLIQGNLLYQKGTHTVAESHSIYCSEWEKHRLNRSFKVLDSLNYSKLK